MTNSNLSYVNSETRIFGYDLIKTIAIIMIVFYHLGGIDLGTVEPGEYYFPNFNKILLSFCAASVPLFLMVHGALVLPKHLNLKESLLKTMQMLFLFLFGKIVLQHLLLEKVFSISEEMVHFWFLGTLAMVYLLSWVLNLEKWMLIGSMVLLIVYPFLSNLLYDFIIFFRPGSAFHTFGHDGFFTLYALVYFYLGYHLKYKIVSLPFILTLVFVGLFLINFEVIAMSNHLQQLYDGVSGSFPTLGALCLSVGLFCLLKDKKTSYSILRYLISLIGSNTLGIFMIHVMVIFLLRKYAHIDSLCLISTILLALFIAFVIALLFYYLKSILRCFEQLNSYHSH